MKKLLAIMLAALMLISLMACEKPADSGSEDPTAAVTGTPGDGNAEGTPGVSETPSENSGAPKATIQSEPNTSCEITWIAIDGTNGTLEITWADTATEEDLEGSGFNAPLTMKETVSYDVTYTKDTQGVYTASGADVAVGMTIEGADAAAFMQAMIAMYEQEEDDLSKLTVRAFRGEKLTGEDVQKYTYEIDGAVEITFTLEDGEMTVQEFTKTYSEWGSMTPVKEVYKIEAGVLRVVEEYEREELSKRTYYRANGVIEKEVYYYEGEESGVTNYDENGEEIE